LVSFAGVVPNERDDRGVSIFCAVVGRVDAWCASSALMSNADGA
jgi:hypothetical protein